MKLLKKIALRSKNPVLSLDISPDNTQVVIGQQGDEFGNPSLSIWDFAKEEQVVGLETDKYTNINSVYFSENGDKVIYEKNQSELFICEIANLKFDKLETNNKNTNCLSLAKEANRLIALGTSVEVWDIQTLERVWLLTNYMAAEDPKYKPATGDIFPDGSKVAIAGTNTGYIHIYDIQTNMEVQKITNAPASAHQLKLSPNVKYLAAIGAFSEGIFVWNIEDGKRYLPNIFRSDRKAYWSMCFHPSSKYLILGTLVGYVSMFRLSDGRRISMNRVHNGRVWSVAFSANGQTLVSGGDDGAICVFEFDEDEISDSVRSL